MTLLALVERAWNDSVWSKVIASGITAGLGVMFVLPFHYWEGLKVAKTPIFQIANAPIVVPAWLAAALGILLVGAVRLALRAGRSGGTDDHAVQPNALPIVEATIVAPSFLSDQPH